MSFPRYANYKDTGVEWLGAVPRHWTVQPLKVAAHVEMGQSPPSDLCAPDGPGIPFLQGCAEFGEVFPSPKSYCGQPPKMARAGDTLLSVRAPVGAMNTADQAYGIGRGLCALRSNINQQFLRYSLETGRAELDAVATGSTYAAVSVADVGRLPVPAPPANEQRAIADFLDRETAKIDALVEAQRRLIALLKEKRQAVISHAVTKGLDPSVPLKPSGIPWLGDVPAHWSVRPLRAVSTEPDTVFIDGDWIEAKDISDDGIRYVTTGNVGDGLYKEQGAGFIDEEKFKELNCTDVLPGDVLISRLNAPVGRACIVPNLGVRIVTSVDNVIVRPDRAVHRAFLVHFLSTKQYFFHTEALARGTTMQRVSRTILGNIRIALPGIDEQREIEGYISRECTKLDGLIQGAENGIALLHERRAALISAAVTGKIDVRGWTAEQVRNGVGAEIVHLHARDRTFGRVQNQKLLFLAQNYVGIEEIGGRFQRKAAGPHDADLMASIERALTAEGVMQVAQPGGPGSQVLYTVAAGTRPDHARLRAMLGNQRLAKLNHLLEVLADEDTRGVEAVATLYGVWNDALLDGETPDEERLIRGFMEWHPEKAIKFKADDVRNRIGFMRRNGLVPEGRGSRTQVGALL